MSGAMETESPNASVFRFRPRWGRLLLAAVIPAFFGACGGPSGTADPNPVDPDGTPDPPENPIHITSLPYRTEGDFIIKPMRYDTAYTCVGDSLVASLDSVGLDTTRFEAFDSTLFWYESHRQKFASGAVVERYRRLVRIGPGRGLQGKWRQDGSDYRVVSGSLAVSEAHAMDSILEDGRRLDSFASIDYEFGEGILRIRSDVHTSEMMLAYWQGTLGSDGSLPASDTHDIDARILDRYTVEFRGRVTGETVRVTQWSGGGRLYESSDSSHTSLLVPSRPQSCPTINEPAWYREFLDGNAK